MNATFKKTVVAGLIATISSATWAFVPNVPYGWTLVKSLNTVKIYKENNRENYMQVLDISNGATVELVQEYAGYNYIHQSPRENKWMHSFSTYTPQQW